MDELSKSAHIQNIIGMGNSRTLLLLAVMFLSFSRALGWNQSKSAKDTPVTTFPNCCVLIEVLNGTYIIMSNLSKRLLKWPCTPLPGRGYSQCLYKTVYMCGSHR